MEEEIILRSQIIRNKFVNGDYKNGNNDKRGEGIQSINAEKRAKKLFHDALNKKFKIDLEVEEDDI